MVRFAENGSLLSYLQSHRKDAANAYENINREPNTCIEYEEKLMFAHGIAKGMRHLAKRKVGNKQVNIVSLQECAV